MLLPSTLRPTKMLTWHLSQNDLRELDFDYDAIDARSLDPVDQFLAIRELVDDFEDLLVRQVQRKGTYVCPYCRRKFLRAAQVCTV